MCRDRVADAVEVLLDMGDGAEVAGLPGGEEEELVEELEGGRGGLVDTGDDNNLGVVRNYCVLLLSSRLTYVVALG